jgi:hypothetical protein
MSYHLVGKLRVCTAYFYKFRYDFSRVLGLEKPMKDVSSFSKIEPVDELRLLPFNFQGWLKKKRAWVQATRHLFSLEQL